MLNNKIKCVNIICILNGPLGKFDVLHRIKFCLLFFRFVLVLLIKSNIIGMLIELKERLTRFSKCNIDYWIYTVSNATLSPIEINLFTLAFSCSIDKATMVEIS